mmetsp:Transcript_76050/g.211360  ORF Transcript_76050/g.211360 Transcript_76050/m.211360 type:complete len:283 (+) Transcript_76050:240-1088(+)
MSQLMVAVVNAPRQTSYRTQAVKNEFKFLECRGVVCVRATSPNEAETMSRCPPHRFAAPHSQGSRRRARALQPDPIEALNVAPSGRQRPDVKKWVSQGQLQRAAPPQEVVYHPRQRHRQNLAANGGSACLPRNTASLARTRRLDMVSRFVYGRGDDEMLRLTPSGRLVGVEARNTGGQQSQPLVFAGFQRQEESVVSAHAVAEHRTPAGRTPSAQGTRLNPHRIVDVGELHCEAWRGCLCGAGAMPYKRNRKPVVHCHDEVRYSERKRVKGTRGRCAGPWLP